MPSRGFENDGVPRRHSYSGAGPESDIYAVAHHMAASPTSPSPARSRRGPSLSPLKGGEGLLRVILRARATRYADNRFRFPGQRSRTNSRLKIGEGGGSRRRH
jgi:hypothetical protein